MSTVISDNTSYATPADFLARFDVRDVAQWCSDTGVPIASGSLPTNANLLAVLADASGMVESACLTAQRYTVTDLVNLSTSGGNSGAMLKRLVCDLALGLLIERRPSLERDQPAQYVRALEWLAELRAGGRIFAFAEVANAGNIGVIVDSQQDISTRNLTTYQANRYFGQRSNESLPGTAPGAGITSVP